MPEVIVPTDVKLEFVTPVPNELVESTVEPFILYVLPDDKFKLSEEDQPTPEYQLIDLLVAL